MKSGSVRENFSPVLLRFSKNNFIKLGRREDDRYNDGIEMILQRKDAGYVAFKTSL